MFAVWWWIVWAGPPVKCLHHEGLAEMLECGWSGKMGEQIRSICHADLELPNAAPTWNLFDWMQMSFVRCEEPVKWIMNESTPPKVTRSKETSLSNWISTACIVNDFKPIRGNTMCDLLSVLSVHLHLCCCNSFSLLIWAPHTLSLVRLLWLTGSGFFAFLSFPCWTF